MVTKFTHNLEEVGTMKRFILMTMVLVLTLVLVDSSMTGAKVAKPADFYKGKTVTIIIPSRAGNQHDLFARLSTPHLSQAIGAHFVVLDQPEGRGIKANNQIYSAAPDGLVLGWYQFLTLNLNDIFKNPAVRYKAAEYNFVCGLGREPHVFIVKRGGPYQSIQDLKAVKGGKLGSCSRLGNYTLSTVTTAYLLDLDVKVVAGMAPNAIVMSMNQGEIVGAAFTASNAANFANRGLVQPLFVLDIERHPTFPDTPAISELVKLKGDKLDLVNLWNEKLTSTSTIYMAPGVPEDRVAYMRGVFDDIFNNRKVMSEIEKIAGYSPMSRVTGEKLSVTAKTLAKEGSEIRGKYLSLIDRYTVK